MKVPVGAVDEFAPGSIKIVAVGSRSIGVINAGDTFYAVLNVCPHELAPVCKGSISGTTLPCPPGKPEYGLENRILRCPWHGYEFDLGDGGRTVFSTFRARLRMFATSVEDGIVMIEVKDRAARSSTAGGRAPTEAVSVPQDMTDERTPGGLELEE